MAIQNYAIAKCRMCDGVIKIPLQNFLNERETIKLFEPGSHRVANENITHKCKRDPDNEPDNLNKVVDLVGLCNVTGFVREEV